MSSKVKQNILKFGILIVVAAFFIWLDQWTKALAVAHLMNQEDIILIPGVLQLRYLENRGIAFGMFQGWQWIFSIFTVFVLLLIFWVVYKIDLKRHTLPVYIICVLVVGGAIGNFIDRVTLGYVVDFIYFSLIDFPIFNVADILVTCSSIFAILALIFIYKEEEINQVFKGLSQKKEKKD